MAERPTFGRRGVKTDPRGGAADVSKTRRAPPPRLSRPGDDLPIGAATVAATRKRIAGWSLATAGALTAAGLWFAETAASPCIDDPATPLVDESKVGECADRAGASGHRSGGHWGHWVWRSGGRSTSSAVGVVSSSAPSSTAKRGGFGSSGFFHGFGGG